MNTILLIDKDWKNRKRVQKHLLYLGLRIGLLEARYGLTGLALAWQTAVKVNLILLDMNLPDIDGFEVLHHLRKDERTAKLKIVALTANTLADERSHYLNAGFDAYLSKPIMRLELIYLLRRFLPSSFENEV
jgi:CheY-like chemotaxis protein